MISPMLSDCFIRRCRRFLAGVVLLLLLSACAPTSTIIVDDESVTNPKPMYIYKSLIIRDFELKREYFTDSGEADMGSREKRYAALPAELSRHIEQFVGARKIYRTVSRSGEPQATTLVLNGEFTRVGRFRISVVVRLIDGGSGQEVAAFRQTLWDVLDATVSIADLGREVAEFLERIQYK
ncbi:MAG TPA: hypothetical protein HPP76_10625 [Desulfuromonadales bacterium]|nr:hypothetical protein [Desulfuromonadales bacterium]